MLTRSSDENSVCPSVCLSNACIVTKWKKDLCRFFIPYEISFSLVFEKNGWRGRPLLPEILGQQAPVGGKSPILLVAPQPYPHSEKVQLTLIENPVRAFQ